MVVYHCCHSVPCLNVCSDNVCCMAELRQEMLKRQGGDYANIAEPVLELKSRSK